MRKLVQIATVLLLCAAGVYLLYLQPEIRVLFQSNEPADDPLDFLKDLPEISPKPRTGGPKRFWSRPRLRAAAPPPPAETQSPPAPTVHNEIPNDEVARAMLGILAAKKLGRHLGLSVSDDEIAVYGEAASPAEAAQIRDILERGRETRSVNTDGLIVQPR